MKKSTIVLPLVLIAATVLWPPAQVAHGLDQALSDRGSRGHRRLRLPWPAMATEAAPVGGAGRDSGCRCCRRRRQCTACTDPKGCVTLAKDDPLRLAWLFVVEGADGSLGTDTKHGAEIAQDDRPTVAGHTGRAGG